MRRSLVRTIVLFLAAMLAGCAVPVRPVQKPAIPAGYVHGGTARGDRLDAAWWHDFHNPSLDRLIALGLRQSPTLAAARALIVVARANAAAANGAYLPQLGLNSGVSRQAYPAGPYGFGAYTIDQITGSISYNPGLFGARAYTFRNGTALVAYQRATAAAARLTLADNIVIAAITGAGLRARIRTDRAMAVSEQHLLTLLTGEFAAGAITRLPVLQQRAQVEALRAAIPTLIAQASVERHALAVLTGTPPAAFKLPAFRIADFAGPRLPPALPSALVAGRPDIVAAWALVAADHATLGQTVAALYPSLSLTAEGGYASETFNSLFQPGAALWTLAGSLLAPIFDGGMLRAHELGARARMADALAIYRGTVLTAFGQVADALRATEQDHVAVAASNAAAATADAAFHLARDQFTLGAADYNTVLSAEIAWRQAQLAAVAARTTAALNRSALAAALAGVTPPTPSIGREGTVNLTAAGSDRSGR